MNNDSIIFITWNVVLPWWKFTDNITGFETAYEIRINIIINYKTLIKILLNYWPL